MADCNSSLDVIKDGFTNLMTIYIFSEKNDYQSFFLFINNNSDFPGGILYINYPTTIASLRCQNPKALISYFSGLKKIAPAYGRGNNNLNAHLSVTIRFKIQGNGVHAEPLTSRWWTIVKYVP